MGGDLEVESSLGVGSTFYFSLPFKVPDTVKIQRQLLPTDELLGIPVLVVDDNKLGCKIIAQLLERMQFRVVVADTADSALAAVRTAQQAGEPFRLLIIDNVMPEISGLQLIRTIKAEHLSQAPRILMVNANNNLKSQLVEQDGVAAVIDKPVQASALFNAIMQVFGYALSTKPVPNSGCFWRDVKLLVVEDVELNRQVVRDLLYKVGIECSEAINGEVALEMVRHQSYDLVLMDLQMPIMDGFEATRKIRKLDNCGADKLPILAMSADALEHDRRNSSASGMNDHIAKPIDPDTLYQQLKRWLPAQKQIRISTPELLAEDDVPELFSVHLPTVDTKIGLRYAGGKRRQYLRHLHGFAEQLADAVSLLPEELVHDQQQALIRIHTLKGLAGTIGTTKLQELARQLETQLVNKEPLSALEQLLSLASELHMACAGLPVAESGASDRELLVEPGQLPRERPNGTSSELLALLEQLSPALENLQARLCSESIAKLRQKNWPAELVNDIDKLQQLVERYRFIQALDVLRSLQQKITTFVSGAK
jgi:CheY-like chemotaxis protein/HPt (histidine-containing phosphotransfer) domain-containing protein